MAILMILFALVSFALYFAAYKGCEHSGTATHSIEVYHGNWWATWHTPSQIRLMVGSMIATVVFLIAAIITALAL